MMLLEAINRLRTGGQKKRTNNDLQNTTQKKIEQHEPTKQTSERTCSDEVRDFDKNSTQPEIRVNRIRDNESQLYID
jgi:hypothetical protein